MREVENGRRREKIKHNILCNCWNTFSNSNNWNSSIISKLDIFLFSFFILLYLIDIILTTIGLNIGYIGNYNNIAIYLWNNLWIGYIFIRLIGLALILFLMRFVKYKKPILILIILIYINTCLWDLYGFGFNIWYYEWSKSLWFNYLHNIPIIKEFTNLLFG